MTKTSLLFAGAAALLSAVATPTLAPAQTASPDAQAWGGPCGGYGPGWGMGQGPWMGQGMGPGAGRGFGMGRGGGMIDLDHDGVVVPEEAAAHADQRFSALDLDGDDAVSEDEFMAAAPMGRGAMMGWGGGARMYRFRAERFKEFDADGDGSVSRAEFIGSAEAAFGRADADGDGKVTVWEFRAARRPQ